MKQFFWRSKALILMMMLAAVAVGQSAYGQSLTLRCLPMTATANSVWTFEAVWKSTLDTSNANNTPPLPDYLPQPCPKKDIQIDTSKQTVAHGVVLLQGVGGGATGYAGIPMYWVEGAADDPGGAIYRVTVSAGLSLSDPKLQPESGGGLIYDSTNPDTFMPTYDDHNNLLWELVYPATQPSFFAPMWYAGGLQGYGFPTVLTGVHAFAYDVRMVFNTEKLVYEPKTTEVASPNIDNPGITIWGASGWRAADPRFVRYGGGGNEDYLSCRGGVAGGIDAGTDPLAVTPVLAMDPSHPDDGSSSHTFTFRVDYFNFGKLPPINWGLGGGVLTFLGYNGAAVQPLGMGLETGTADNGTYMRRFQPTAGNAYTSMPVGIYNYWFACSDDSLTFPLDPSGSRVLDYQPDMWGMDAKASEWDYPYGRTPLDPTGTRKVTGLTPDLDRTVGGRRYAVDDGSQTRDFSTFVDRPTLAPGTDGGASPYSPPCTGHPIVSCSLTMSGSDITGAAYNDTAKYGGARFWGTLWPFKRLVNPRLPGSVTYEPVVDTPRSEASGVAANEEVEYRILWRSSNNNPPTDIQVYINNASAKSKNDGISNDLVDGVPTDSDSDYNYTAYTMTADPVDLVAHPNAYVDGVWYRYRTRSLTPGPHTYYFKASDTLNTCIWPRRPDATGTATVRFINDNYVPTASLEPMTQADFTGYDDNDFVPGPYVNTPPVLSEPSVTPTSGKAGQSYRFRVKYMDVDGQRPFSAYVYIKTDDNAVPSKFAMLPETVMNPTTDHRAEYKSGVYYYFDTATLQGKAMANGMRHYYFEFTDDWGKPVDVNDRISGDTVNVVSKLVNGNWIPDGQWKDGPYITGPIAPTLTQGKVESADGTANSATQWKFSVKYTSANNNAPQVMKVFIGLLQPDGKTVLWDSGHDMPAADPTDVVYTDGAYYNYVTRLQGKIFPDDSAKQYFYAYYAYDGVTWAEYRAATSTDPGSDAASLVRNLQLADSGDGKTFGIPTGFALTGPIMGPLPVTLAVPAGVMSDAQLFKGGSIQPVDGLDQLVGGVFSMIDDQKSGWQGDQRYGMMKGVATDQFKVPSRDYVLPDDDASIASVQGVYTSLADLEAGTNSYYDPTLAPTADVVQLCRVSPTDINKQTFIVDNAWRVGQILGVYATQAAANDPAPPDPNPDLLKCVDQDGSVLNGKGQIIITAADNPGLGTSVWLKYRRIGYDAGRSTIWLTSSLPESYAIGGANAGGTVYIKYDDMRFTHQMRGTSIGVDAYGNRIRGWTHFLPDGSGGTAVSFKGNDGGDPTGGIIGIWLDGARTSDSFWEPFRRLIPNNNLDKNNVPQPVRLSVEAPGSGQFMYAQYYQLGEYNIDRWNRLVAFKSAPASDVFMTAVYGRKMQDTVGNDVLIGENTAPFLFEGKVTPLSGSRTTSFVYTVRYEDKDGPNGQAPEFVRVYIDGVAHDMLPPSSGGTPAYRDGPTYTYVATGLSGGSHQYRFDASDGASSVLYDQVSATAAASDPNLLNPQSMGHRYDVDPAKNTLSTVIQDINGPWVNNPPTLTNGLATPNPAAGIAPSDSVTYTVTYSDIDNDAPFVYSASTDASGLGLNGTPRVWIDSPTKDVSYDAKASVANPLSPDPLVVTKKRIINVDTASIVASDGSSNVWTSNQFAGALLQITSGPNLGRVCLIQSNTANSLTIATDDLATDLAGYFTNGTLNQDIKFRINGLEMSKADPTDSTYTDGVAYQLTVPGLAVGSHKFHFTARSRVTAPSWLAQAIDPFSDEVRFPATGDSTGPLVVSDPPADNLVPTLSNSGLLSGPYAKMGTLVSSTVARLDDGGNWSPFEASNVSQVIGVYLNATLDTDTSLDVTNYLTVPVGTFPADYSFSLTASLAAPAAGTELVQFGVPASDSTIGGASLLKVTPDSAGSIGTVLGVYLTGAMTGTNYYGSFNGTTIALSTPLPAGTTQVYIDYTLKAGVTKPPVYVKYYQKATATTVFLSGDPITYYISYSDDDPPSYHNNLSGYVRLVFPGSNTLRFMIPLTVPADYLTPVPLYTTIYDTPEGSQKYSYLGSDGYDPKHQVRYPTLAANDPTVTVNYKPVLSNVGVSPIAGLQNSSFTFTATYKDVDGTDPNKVPSVNVRLMKIADGNGNAVKQELPLRAMTAGTESILTGRTYTLTIASGVLDPGSYSVTFEAYDGMQAAIPVTMPTPLLVRLTNAKPVIVDVSMAPVAGKTSATFYYSAHYMDPDNDAPGLGNGLIYPVQVVIDKGTTKQRIVKMTKVIVPPIPGQPAPTYTDPAGVLFRSDAVSGTSLGIGTHTYEVQASDSMLAADPKSVTNAPIMLVPFFTNLRIVGAGATKPQTADGLPAPNVGDNVLIVGQIKFPKNDVTGKPADDQSITFTINKPDGSTFALKGSITMEDDSVDAKYWVGDVAVVSYQAGGDSSLVNGINMTMSATGEWTFSAKRDSDAKWDSAQTDSVIDGYNDIFKAVVGGPMRTAAVKNPLDPASSSPLVDMVTPAMVIADGDVGRIFGFDRVRDMDIVRWDPLTSSYYRYGIGAFPAVRPGDAVWIKPKLSYTAESVNSSDISSGLLSNGNPSVDLYASQSYRVLHVYSKAYALQSGTTKKAPMSIVLHPMWNQFGNIFFNYKKLAGLEITPKQDVGIPFSELKVKYLNQTLSIADAAAAGWIRDYAWRYDAAGHQYVLVSAKAAGAERVLKAWSGYWIRTFVDCELIIDPNTTYNGETLSSMSLQSRGLDSVGDFDAPPAAPGN